MVATTQSHASNAGKAHDKTIASKAKTSEVSKYSVGENKLVVSPSGSPSTSDEVALLKAQNKALAGALESIKKTAAEELKRSYDLVWFANYRYRYPNHEASGRIDNTDSYKTDITNLRGADGDFHHGFNSGVLASARLFEQCASLDMSKLQDLDTEMMAETAKHTDRMKKARASFPNTEVDNESFPKEA